MIINIIKRLKVDWFVFYGSHTVCRRLESVTLTKSPSYTFALTINTALNVGLIW